MDVGDHLGKHQVMRVSEHLRELVANMLWASVAAVPLVVKHATGLTTGCVAWVSTSRSWTACPAGGYCDSVLRTHLACGVECDGLNLGRATVCGVAPLSTFYVVGERLGLDVKQTRGLRLVHG